MRPIFFIRLIVEIPGQAELQDVLIDGVMGRQEEILVALPCIDVMHHDEETGTFQLEVGIDIHDRVGTDGNGVLLILQVKLLNRWGVGWGVILREDAYIGT